MYLTMDMDMAAPLYISIYQSMLKKIVTDIYINIIFALQL